jgi:hypothetical protein
MLVGPYVFDGGRRMRSLSFHAVALAMLVALTVGASVANAGRSPASRNASASLCSVSRVVATQLARATALNETATPAGLKKAYGALESAKPTLIAAAHGTLKTDLRRVFGFVDLVTSDLKKANWQLANLAPFFPALLAKEKAVAPSFKRLNTYYRTKCHFKV